MFSTISIPFFKPQIQGTFNVPLSRRSGYTAGCEKSNDDVPVPPSIIVEKSRFLWSNAPVPMGPRSPLCPGTQRQSIPCSFISSFITPAPCAPSVKKYAPFPWAISDSSFKGRIFPKTLETAVTTQSFVLLLNDFLKFSTVSSLSSLTLKTV